MPSRSYYEVLGVARDADAATIKSAYRALAHRYHPDVNPGDPSAEEAFKEVNAAYAVLSDARLRAGYDRTGRVVAAQTASTSVQDVVENIIGAFRGRRKARERGRDVRYTLEVDFLEAARGGERTIRYTCGGPCTVCANTGGVTANRPCGTCGGSGRIEVGRGGGSRRCTACHGAGRVTTQPCSHCRGSGRVLHEREFVVRLPPGTEDGHVRTVSGAGEAGRAGGRPGDLHVVVKVKEHPLLRRDGRDVTCDVPVGVSIAALGGVADVPTIDGMVRLKVPPGIQSGEVLRLQGKGLPSKTGRGDQRVRVVVETPRPLSAEQRHLFETLGERVGPESSPRQVAFAAAMRKLYG